jgi:hypothetical protein
MILSSLGLGILVVVLFLNFIYCSFDIVADLSEMHQYLSARVQLTNCSSICDVIGFICFVIIISCFTIEYTTNNLVSAQSETLTESEPDTSSDYSTIVIIFIFLIIIAVIWKLTHRTKRRRYFTAEVKKQVLKDQNYKCAICKRRSAGLWDYDHIDGNRSNDNISNCQALCPNCHAKKTRGLLKQEKSSKRRIIIAIVIIMIFLVFFIWLSETS